MSDFPPAVSFRQEAHAIPEALGNKTLFVSYECDRCNNSFGRGIENDLGKRDTKARSLANVAEIFEGGPWTRCCPRVRPMADLFRNTGFANPIGRDGI